LSYLELKLSDIFNGTMVLYIFLSNGQNNHPPFKVPQKSKSKQMDAKKIKSFCNQVDWKFGTNNQFLKSLNITTGFHLFLKLSNEFPLIFFVVFISGIFLRKFSGKLNEGNGENYTRILKWKTGKFQSKNSH
jgi:hypothetical protein